MSLMIFTSFKRQLNASFLDRLKAGAEVVADKVSINPRIVPLPHGNEHFTIVYKDDYSEDTLFSDHSIAALRIADKDSTFFNAQSRGIVFHSYPETGGRLTILYTLPAKSVNSRIQLMLLLILISVPVGSVLAAVLAYVISGRILKPVMQVIRQANETNIRTGNMALINTHSNDAELRELSDSFNRMIERISEQSLRQSAFFASASHELRTPLSVMQTRLQVLAQQEKLSAENGIFLNEQLTEVRRLTKMVNDFLMMTELQQGTMQAIREEIALTELIPAIIAEFRQKSAEKHLTTDMTFLPPESDFVAVADTDKLRIILTNLLENAIKYSPDDEHINVTCIEKNESISVVFSNRIRADINPDISAIAKEFYHSKPFKGEGSGLGLWIVHALAEIQDIVVTTAINERLFTASIVIKSNPLH